MAILPVLVPKAVGGSSLIPTIGWDSHERSAVLWSKRLH